MARLRYNGLRATLGASLTSSATSITFSAKLTHSGGTDVPTITGSDFIPLAILDPTTGKLSEVVYLTAYTTAGTTGTIARGKEGTSGVAHTSGDTVVHGPGVADILDGGLLAYNVYAPATTVSFTPTTSTTDVDATNAAVTFTVPASGNVFVRFECGQNQNAQAGFVLCLREGTTVVPKTWTRRGYYATGAGSGGQIGVTASWIITGLTPGDVHTYKVAFQKNGTGTASTLICGNADDPAAGGWGQMTTVVSAAPLL